VFQRDGDI